MEDLDKAFERVKNVAVLLNAKRIREERGWELLSCVEVGRCVDCNAENRICNIITIIEKKPRAIDISMIIVGEEESENLNRGLKLLPGGFFMRQC